MTTANIVLVFVILSAVFQIAENVFFRLFRRNLELSRLSPAALTPSSSNHHRHDRVTVVHVSSISGLRDDQDDMGNPGRGSSDERGRRFSQSATLPQGCSTPLSGKFDKRTLQSSKSEPRIDGKQLTSVQFNETKV